MFERFTESARQVVALAQEEARLLAHEHENVAARILVELGADAGAIREYVARQLPPPEPTGELGTLWDVVEEAKERLIEAQRFEAAARLRDDQRALQQMLAGRMPLPARWDYDVKTLVGASDTWVAQLEEWRTDGWELIGVVQEGGAVRAIVERRRRSSLD